MFARTLSRALVRPIGLASRRTVATLEGNPNIVRFDCYSQAVFWANMRPVCISR